MPLLVHHPGHPGRHPPRERWGIPGLGLFRRPLIATVLWIPATFVLLLPQFQPVERDDNRPI